MLYYTLFDEVFEDDNKFFNYFGMSKASFFELLDYVKGDISGVNTRMRRGFFKTRIVFYFPHIFTTFINIFPRHCHNVEPIN